jgi:hypothetical protein
LVAEIGIGDGNPIMTIRTKRILLFVVVPSENFIFAHVKLHEMCQNNF